MEPMPKQLRSLLGRRYGLDGAGRRVAAGVSGSTLWRVASPVPLLVRVSEHFDVEHITRVCHDVLRLKRHLPEVVAPLVADDGTTVFLWAGRPVAVWPYVSGVHLDRRDAEEVEQAARLLAKLHQIAPDADAAAPRSSIPGEDNALLAARLLPDPELEARLDRWRGRSARSEKEGWRHGDFFDQNIVCHEGRLAGLVDWDDLSIGPTDVELAWATWEFAKSARGDRLELPAASAFLHAYQAAGGCATRLEELVWLIRERLRRDIAFFRRIALFRGCPIDEEDERPKRDAFASLRELSG